MICKKTFTSISIIFSILSLTANAQKKVCKEYDPLLWPRERSLDFTELKLEVNFDVQQKLIFANVLHTFTPIRSKVESFFLDAKDINIKEAKLNDVSITFKKDTAGYIFYPAQVLVIGKSYYLSLKYESKPQKGLYFTGWGDTATTIRKQIWTQGQGTDNRHWIPMYDEMNDKVISDITVHFDKNYKVLSNGNKLQEKENADGTKTWRYRMPAPHAPYLIMLAIGKYEVKESKSKSGVPMRFYYYPEHKDRIDFIYKNSERIMDFMEKETGVSYPWKCGYSQVPVQDFMYGAMENTSATVFGDFYCVDSRAFLDRNYISTNAHELAHMWFGNLITARSASHIWLQESFATYYQMLFDKEMYGNDMFDWQRRNAINQALAASNSDLKPIVHSASGSTRWYPKGALVLDMLKNLVGPDSYHKVIKYYLEKNAFKNVDSHELLLAFHDVLGVSLDWFWEQWLYRGGEPHFKVSYNDIKNSKNERFTEILIEQKHEVSDLVGVFRMPIKMEVYYKDGSKDTITANIDQSTQVVSIPNKNNLSIDFVLFDPNSLVLKQVTFHKYQEELISQLLKAPYMLDRYAALVDLKGVEVAKKRDALISTFYKEKFHSLKVEIIQQLQSDTSMATYTMLQRAIEDKDVLVRKSMASIIDVLPPSFEPKARKLLIDSSYQVVELALDKLSKKYPEFATQYLQIASKEQGFPGMNVRIKWLEIQVSKGNTDYAKQLSAMVTASYEFRTRINAMEALKRVNYLDTTAAIGLAQAASHFNARLAGAASASIQHFAKQSAYADMFLKLTTSDKLTPLEQKSLKKNLK